MTTRTTIPLLVTLIALELTIGGPAQAASAMRAVLPDALIDLRTQAGVSFVGGQWRYRDAAIREIDHRGVGPDLRASGAANRTFDFTPDARASDFDDSDWPVIAPTSLEQRRGNGRLSFNWYRISVTVPKTVAAFETKGSTIVFEAVVDDYAEVWVNGKAPLVLGQTGGSVAAGWNAPNRVVLTRDARPGEKFQIALFGINGPISAHPDTYIWLRSATLDFYAPGKLSMVRNAKLGVERKDARLDQVLPSDAKLEHLAEGFAFTEGPVWVGEGDGYLLFSDPNNNTIYRMTAEGEVSVYLAKSGYTGTDIGQFRQPGSNGLALDEQGRVTVCQHGNRRVIRIEKNGTTTVLADSFEGKRLNSPNDLVYRSDGTLFFTDPPFGLPKFHEDPSREQAHFGVYAVRNGTVSLVAKDFSGPNGLAFSPDEKVLYVGNWGDQKKVVYRYSVLRDGTLGKGELFFDMTSATGADAIDGVKVDQLGNVYISGPGGLWIVSPEGKHLGTLRGPEHPHNMAWGDADRRSLYWTAQTGIYRLRLKVLGAGSAHHTQQIAGR